MSWDQIEAMAREGRREWQQLRSRPPVDCPIDGTPLVIRANGLRNCPMGNYRYPRDEDWRRA